MCVCFFFRKNQKYFRCKTTGIADNIFGLFLKLVLYYFTTVCYGILSKLKGYPPFQSKLLILRLGVESVSLFVKTGEILQISFVLLL